MSIMTRFHGTSAHELLRTADVTIMALRQLAAEDPEACLDTPSLCHLGELLTELTYRLESRIMEENDHATT